MAKKRGLGRSLEALLTKPTALTEESRAQEDEREEQSGSSKSGLAHLAVTHITSGKYQPRRHMNPESLQELSDSIRSQGIIQPIVVRPLAKPGHYEIIAGERRWRAAQLAGLTEVPVIIRDLTDEAAMAMALIENIQREDLNAIEEAIALQKLIDEFEMTHQQVAEAVGKSRTAISNSLRLLALTAEVKQAIESGELEMGHGRALLSLPANQQIEIARSIINQSLSVRQTERLVRQLQEPKADHSSKPSIDPDLKRIQDSLSQRLGLKVNIESNPNGKGKLVIHYRNLTEFDNLVALLPEKVN